MFNKKILIKNHREVTFSLKRNNKMENLENREVLNKEIDLIQGCINRMAHNSFIIKGWLISLIAVVLTLLPENFEMKWLCIVGLLVTICFWYLDGYFLKLERLFRWKYEWVIVKRLDTDKWCYDLNPYNKEMWLINPDGTEKRIPKEIEVMLSKTLLPIYIPIIIVIISLLINSYMNFI